MPFIRLLCLTALLCFPQAIFAQDDAPTGSISVETSAQVDANIATRMREILQELGGYGDVTVLVEDGVLTLRGTTDSKLEATELDGLASRLDGVVAIKNQVTETAEIGRRLTPAIDRFKERVEQFLVFLPLFLIASAVFMLVVFVGFMIARARQPWARLAPNAFIADLFRQILRILFVIGGLVIALDILNATALLSTILGAAGIIGLALGFAVRDTVENFIASVLLSIRQPFQPNDTVEINGDEGKVIRLTSRATILLSFDGNHIRIPNSTVFKSRILNYSQNRERRFKFTITVDTSADMEAIRAMSVEVVQDLPFVLETPGANAWINGLMNGGIQLTVVGWIDQGETSLALAKGEALRQVKLAVEAAGVTMPDTTYRILLEGGEPSSKPATKSPRKAAAAKQVEMSAVHSEEDDDLSRMIDAERAQPETQDLLKPDALKE